MGTSIDPMTLLRVGGSATLSLCIAALVVHRVLTRTRNRVVSTGQALSLAFADMFALPTEKFCLPEMMMLAERGWTPADLPTLAPLKEPLRSHPDAAPLAVRALTGATFPGDTPARQAAWLVATFDFEFPPQSSRASIAHLHQEVVEAYESACGKDVAPLALAAGLTPHEAATLGSGPDAITQMRVLAALRGREIPVPPEPTRPRRFFLRHQQGRAKEDRG